jgi:hypothetical protein
MKSLALVIVRIVQFALKYCWELGMALRSHLVKVLLMPLSAHVISDQNRGKEQGTHTSKIHFLGIQARVDLPDSYHSASPSCK